MSRIVIPPSWHVYNLQDEPTGAIPGYGLSDFLIYILIIPILTVLTGT